MEMNHDTAKARVAGVYADWFLTPAIAFKAKTMSKQKCLAQFRRAIQFNPR